MRLTLRYLTIALVLMGVSCAKHHDPTPNGGGGGGGTTTILPLDYLTGVKYDHLEIEVQYVKNHQPSAATLENLKTFLLQRLNKPAGIEFIQSVVTSPGKSVMSLTDIQNFEKTNRTRFTTGTTLAAYFFFGDFEYSENTSDSKVLGMAYGSSSMVIFEKTVLDLSGGIGEPSQTTLETTVVEHEFGHTLGLVNNGTEMTAQHQDTAHGRHCSNTSCLMYYAVETSDFVGNLVGGSIPVLDANCLADLKANGGQ